MYDFVSAFITKAACCRNINIVLHPLALSYVCKKVFYIYVFVYIHINGENGLIFRQLYYRSL